jgi:hypothetical protein
MSERSDNVRAIRETVDETIRVLQAQTFGHVIGSDNSAQFGDISYGSFGPADMRPNTVGAGQEHRWAVVQRQRRVGQYSCSAALVAVEGQPVTLVRRLLIAGPLSAGIPTEMIIDDPEDIELAAQWARSPQLYGMAISRLFEPNDSEQDYVTAQYAELTQAAHKLRDELAELDRARAWFNAQ